MNAKDATKTAEEAAGAEGEAGSAANAQSFLDLSQQIPTLKEAFASIRKQQEELNKTSEQIADAAQKTVAEVSLAIQRINSDVEQEVHSLLDEIDVGGGRPNTGQAAGDTGQQGVAGGGTTQQQMQQPTTPVQQAAPQPQLQMQARPMQGQQPMQTPHMVQASPMALQVASELRRIIHQEVQAQIQPLIEEIRAALGRMRK
ncbi:hypothetical protein E1162_18345 [Rhodobacteraceae bacterium RKSG542]|uniref:hypothetical protein n=1 Tax=Pseudovibrio flavus TaxID=2529854 RepID=UPI0012BD69B8|nr:hypothetical protein [Pseudovibrio flavus]MTI19205.1 hypothetical protein [Pseudovibrio flavus]